MSYFFYSEISDIKKQQALKKGKKYGDFTITLSTRVFLYTVDITKDFQLRKDIQGVNFKPHSLNGKKTRPLDIEVAVYFFDLVQKFNNNINLKAPPELINIHIVYKNPMFKTAETTKIEFNYYGCQERLTFDSDFDDEFGHGNLGEVRTKSIRSQKSNCPELRAGIRGGSVNVKQYYGKSRRGRGRR